MTLGRCVAQFFRRAALATDRIAALKAEYEAAGGERSNLRYGYVTFG